MLFFKLCTLIFLIFAVTSCKNGQTLRIGGQDIFAFGAQDACHFNRNNLGIRISWKGSIPISMVIHKSVPTEYDEVIRSAAGRWNAASGKNLITVYRDDTLDVSPGNDKRNVIFWQTTWDESAKLEQARTSTKWDISKFTDADIRINAKNFRYYKDGDDVTTGRIHFESLIVHEMGHALGLQHFDSESGVMYPYLKAQVERNLPSGGEVGDLACEY